MRREMGNIVKIVYDAQVALLISRCLSNIDKIFG